MPNTNNVQEPSWAQAEPYRVQIDDDVKVLYVVETIECERGYGQRPEGFICFLTEMAADAYIRDENAAEAKRNPSGNAPDCYWRYHKRGYHVACSLRLLQTKSTTNKRIYVPNINDLLSM